MENKSFDSIDNTQSATQCIFPLKEPHKASILPPCAFGTVPNILTDSYLQANFRDYLIRKGYREFTPSGQRSTVYDYIRRINYVCSIEAKDWGNLAYCINLVIPMYDRNGAKESIGNKSHRAVINALLRYREFIEQISAGWPNSHSKNINLLY